MMNFAMCRSPFVVIQQQECASWRVIALGDAPGADHLDVVVHQRARAGGVAHLDQVGELGVNVENVRASFGVAVTLRRGQDTCSSEMSCTTSTRLCEASATARWKSRDSRVKAVEVADRGLGLAQQAAQLGDVGGGGVLGGELGAERFDRALRVHDLGGGDAGEVELHGERFGEQARIALRDAGAAAFAHADLDDAERLQRAQRVARDDAAGAEARGQVLFGAEEIAGLELLARTARRARRRRSAPTATTSGRQT